MKACTKCGITKPFEEYYRKPEGKDGLSSYCKKCLILECTLRRMRNPEKATAKSRKYYEERKETIKENTKKRYREKKDEINQKINQYKKENPHKVNETNARRRAAKMQAIPKWADFKAIETLYEDARLLTEYLGVQFHVDHIVPLTSKLVCGLHWEGNLQVMLASDNLSKHNYFWPDMP